ncbi:nucleotidyltransferase family protein [Paracoccus lichenicola]|uniref:nucleotidyltransferase family protein n=1 Tax=Paracoccus lichenicola TaxID=2665644 RepID=UPI0012B877C9|nr:nucleotidyltransferase family protein [Paracoccus lichenicola]
MLLAAGRSRRFGPDCKLQAPYRGKPLVRHAAEAILGTGLPAVAVIADPAVAGLLPEFRLVHGRGVQSDSVRLGLRHVADEAALIVLADMPHVTADLLQRIATSRAPAAATDGHRICPPALLPRSLFPQVQALTGDQGAGALLRSLPGLHRIHVKPEFLRDVDVPDDLLSSQDRLAPPRI